MNLKMICRVNEKEHTQIQSKTCLAKQQNTMNLKMICRVTEKEHTQIQSKTFAIAQELFPFSP